MLTRRELLGAMAIAPAMASALETVSTSIPAFQKLAPRPPLGWNSWDSFGATIDEAAARANAAVMAKRLLPFGYDIFTVDIQWYEPGATGFEYRAGAALTMDEWGRLLPAISRFPSAVNGAGFQPLADHLHSLGLRFGVHLMRGVPRQAAERQLPILGTKYTAADIADRVNVCPWNSDMFGVDMAKPGAQAYYDSVFKLLARWQVDFVKVDDLSRPYHRNEPEVEAVRRAIDRCGRPMILSLSPGETPLSAAAHVRRHANMWRISDDFWDNWKALLEQFTRLANWNSHRIAGAWPDADMLPLGRLDLGKRDTNFTRDEQITLMTLWSIARSPLIMGGDLRALDDFTHSILTNKEMLAVNQVSTANREVFRNEQTAVWAASPEGSRDVYVAVFNLTDATATMTVQLGQLGLTGKLQARDLWTHSMIGDVQSALTLSNPAHGAKLLRLSAA